jgi:hypothetical protein
VKDFVTTKKLKPLILERALLLVQSCSSLQRFRCGVEDYSQSYCTNSKEKTTSVSYVLLQVFYVDIGFIGSHASHVSHVATLVDVQSLVTDHDLQSATSALKALATLSCQSRRRNIVCFAQFSSMHTFALGLQYTVHHHFTLSVPTYHCHFKDAAATTSILDTRSKLVVLTRAASRLHVQQYKGPFAGIKVLR